MEEIWKDVPSFEGLYKVSNLGRVASYDRKVNYKHYGKIATKKGKVLSPKVSNTGYLEVTLCDAHGKCHYCRVHRLVAIAFLPNPNNYQVINHIDENKQNNCIYNLEWCSNRENIEKYHANRTVLYQYGLAGNLVKEWNSITKAAELVGGDKTGIQHCASAKSKLKTYFGYIWTYDFLEEKELKHRLEDNKERKVFQFDIHGNYIQSFTSLQKAADAVHCNSSAITLACQGKRKTIKGFIWKYEKS